MSAQDIAAWAGAALWGSRFAWLLLEPARRRHVARTRTPTPSPVPERRAADGILLATPLPSRHLAAAAVQRHFGPFPDVASGLWPGGQLLVVLRRKPPPQADGDRASAVLSVVVRDARAPTPPLLRERSNTADLVPTARPSPDGSTAHVDSPATSSGAADRGTAAAGTEPAGGGGPAGGPDR